MKFYPIIYTRTYGLDFRFWATPQGITNNVKEIEFYVRQTMHENALFQIKQPRHLFVRTSKYILWGTGMRNGMFLSAEFQDDEWERELRGFWGGLIVLPTQENVDNILQLLPFDFTTRAPLATFLFRNYIQPHWTKTSQIGITIGQPAIEFNDNNVDIMYENRRVLDIKKGCIVLIPQKQENSCENEFRAVVNLRKNTSIITGLQKDHAVEFAQKSPIGLDYAGVLDDYFFEQKYFRVPVIPETAPTQLPPPTPKPKIPNTSNNPPQTSSRPINNQQHPNNPKEENLINELEKECNKREKLCSGCRLWRFIKSILLPRLNQSRVTKNNQEIKTLSTQKPELNFNDPQIKIDKNPFD